MVKYKGQLSFCQYLPSKPTKWGIKVWSLCESSTGYMSNFQVYTGREDNQEKGLAYRVVHDLTEPYHNTYIRCYMDNFFTGVDLFNALRRDMIYACGTVHSNQKGLPTYLLPKNVHNMIKGEYKVAQKDDLTYAIWQDTKPVLVLSNGHGPQEQHNVSQKGSDGHHHQIPAPKMVADYQNNMKGVDVCDQMVGYYMPPHRSNKWWHHLFFFLSISIHNAYILAKKSHPASAREKWSDLKLFIQDLVLELIGNVQTTRQVTLVTNEN